MSFTPFPTPLTRRLMNERSLEEHRNLFCCLYDRCLDVSVRSGWENWSCSQCELREHHGTAPRALDYAQRRRPDPTTL